jgi:hypothetical protein
MPYFRAPHIIDNLRSVISKLTLFKLFEVKGIENPEKP